MNDKSLRNGFNRTGKIESSLVETNARVTDKKHACITVDGVYVLWNVIPTVKTARSLVHALNLV